MRGSSNLNLAEEISKFKLRLIRRGKLWQHAQGWYEPSVDLARQNLLVWCPLSALKQVFIALGHPHPLLSVPLGTRPASLLSLGRPAAR